MLLLTKSSILRAKASASETLLYRPLVGRPVTYTSIRNFVPVSLSLLNPLNPLLGSAAQSQEGGSVSEAELPERRNFRCLGHFCEAKVSVATNGTPFRLPERSSGSPLRGVRRKCTVYSLLAERSSVGTQNLRFCEPSASLEFKLSRSESYPFSIMRSRTKCSAERKFGLNSPSALCTALRATPLGTACYTIS